MKYYFLDNFKNFFVAQAPKCSIYFTSSCLDKEKIFTVVKLVLKQKITPYIDWLDDEFENVFTSEDTLQNYMVSKIRSNKKFIFFLTKNSVRSSYCNWALGIAHSLKCKRDDIAIMIDGNTDVLEGFEFRNIYPVIRYAECENKGWDFRQPIDQFVVKYPAINGKPLRELLLSEWLRK